MVLGALTSAVVVIVLTVYFLADLPRIRRGLYRLVPHSRRPRAILIGDEIFAKVGGYVLGNILISVIAAVLTFGWLFAFGVPYLLLLAIMVAVLDLIPVLGSTVAGVVVCLVALTVSLPVALASAGFFVVYRLVEDYVLVPRIIGRVLRVPGLITVTAVLLGGVLLGIIGALVAIPVAAAVLLVIREILVPRLDQPALRLRGNLWRGIRSEVSTDDPRYRNALFHLLTAETSCYRYWGQGVWTDYGGEIFRRAIDILTHG